MDFHRWEGRRLAIRFMALWQGRASQPSPLNSREAIPSATSDRAGWLCIKPIATESIRKLIVSAGLNSAPQTNRAHIAISRAAIAIRSTASAMHAPSIKPITRMASPGGWWSGSLVYLRGANEKSADRGRSWGSQTRVGGGGGKLVAVPAISLDGMGAAQR